jgi:hypothetical protein
MFQKNKKEMSEIFRSCICKGLRDRRTRVETLENHVFVGKAARTTALNQLSLGRYRQETMLENSKGQRLNRKAPRQPSLLNEVCKRWKEEPQKR